MTLPRFACFILIASNNFRYGRTPVLKLLLPLLMAATIAAGGARAADPADTTTNLVQRYGRLQIKNGQLCSQSAEPIQLRGLSSHDLKNFPFGPDTVGNLVKDWHMSVVRAAMYTDSYGSSYVRQPEVKQAVKRIVDGAIQNGIYVIVDWHILQDRNPNTYRAEAKAFFEEMAREYGARPNVLYEICNEPNGADVTWPVIKAYAEHVIPAIRAIDPDNVIIVGTDNWSQGVEAASKSPLAFSNVMYALHFYAGTHVEALRRSADAALARGLPIFASEWGLTDASGKGSLHTDEAQRWIDWMRARKISWANWSFSNCPEGSAALKPAAIMNGPWPNGALTPSGAWVKSRM